MQVAPKVRKFLFLVAFIVPLTPYLCFLFGSRYSIPNAAPFLSLFLFFVILPILDRLMGKDFWNPEAMEIKPLASDRYYRWLLLSCPFWVLSSLFFGAWQFSRVDLYSLGQLGWAMNVGLVGGIMGINVAHELIHKHSRAEQIVGSLLLSSVGYSSFKVEHVHGHHRDVATEADASTARFGQTLYQFLPNAIARNFTKAIRLQKKLLQENGDNFFSWQNELLKGWTMSLVILTVLIGFFGISMIVFFAIQALVAITLLETVNYLEHYGLRRKQLEDGGFEKVTHHHSWNSNYILSNLILFQLQRHSDHHAFPKRPYQLLRHFDDSPQLPAGYATMVVLAFFPPLWKKVMDRRVESYYRTE